MVFVKHSQIELLSIVELCSEVEFVFAAETPRTSVSVVQVCRSEDSAAVLKRTPVVILIQRRLLLNLHYDSGFIPDSLVNVSLHSFNDFSF